MVSLSVWFGFWNGYHNRLYIYSENNIRIGIGLIYFVKAYRYQCDHIGHYCLTVISKSNNTTFMHPCFMDYKYYGKYKLSSASAFPTRACHHFDCVKDIICNIKITDWSGETEYAFPTFTKNCRPRWLLRT